jgi:hypothetical protein
MEEEEGRKKRRFRRRREEADVFGGDEEVRRSTEAADRQVYPPPTPETAPARGKAPAPAPVPPPGVTPEPETPPAPPTPATPPTASQPEAPGEQAPPPPEAGYPPPPEYYGAGYYWPQYGWYPPPYSPPGYGYGAGYPPQPPGASYPLDQTGQIPMGPPPGVAPPLPPPAQFPFPPGPPLAAGLLGEEEEFRELAMSDERHWRLDFKWVFGIIAALLLFAVLTCAGFYRVTSHGDASKVLVPLIETATRVKQSVSNNYSDLKSRARRNKNARIFIPDIGVEVSLEARTVSSLSADDLAAKVIDEVARQIYTRGYRGNLPMKPAQGVGEERGKATCETILSLFNKNKHSALLWAVALIGSLAFVFSMLFLLFLCRGWGKADGIGLVLIAAALPGSLFIRLGTEVFWDTNAGLYRGAMYQAFGNAGALMLMFYDIALGAGALVLLMGVIGGAISRRTRKRVPPFLGLELQEESAEEEPGLQPEPEPAEGPIIPPPPPPPPST